MLDQSGNVRETFAGHGINGPRDMTALDLGNVSDLFVTNVLNGTVNADGSTVDGGTVLRITVTSAPGIVPRRISATRIASGFPETLHDAALVIGPTGVGLGQDGTLYVADILTVNSGDGNIMETTPGVMQAAVKTIDANNGGAGNLFGLAVKPGADAVYFVDDFNNTFNLFH